MSRDRDVFVFLSGRCRKLSLVQPRSASGSKHVIQHPAEPREPLHRVMKREPITAAAKILLCSLLKILLPHHFPISQHQPNSAALHDSRLPSCSEESSSDGLVVRSDFKFLSCAIVLFPDFGPRQKGTLQKPNHLRLLDLFRLANKHLCHTISPSS